MHNWSIFPTSGQCPSAKLRHTPTHSSHLHPLSLLPFPSRLVYLSKPINTMVSTKAEAEALSLEELTTELTSRGLPTEGLKVSPRHFIYFCFAFFWSWFFLAWGSVSPDSKPNTTLGPLPSPVHALFRDIGWKGGSVVRAVGSVVGGV